MKLLNLKHKGPSQTHPHTLNHMVPASSVTSTSVAHWHRTLTVIFPSNLIQNNSSDPQVIPKQSLAILFIILALTKVGQLHKRHQA